MDTVVKPKGSIIKNIYLYLVSFVALMMLIFSVANMLDILLRSYIFTKADDMSYYYAPTCIAPVPAAGTTSTPTPTVKGDPGCLSKEEQKKQQDDQRSSQRQSSLVRDISMIAVAIPVFAYHWMIIRKKEEKE